MALKRISQEEIERLLARPKLSDKKIQNALERGGYLVRVSVDVLQDVYTLLDDVDFQYPPDLVPCFRCGRFEDEGHNSICLLALTKEKLKEYLK